MSDNEREDQEDASWLLARERGQPGPPASEATAARYERLQSMITNLPATPAGITAGAGWQREVLAAIDASEAGPDASRGLPPASSGAVAAPERSSPKSRRRAAITAVLAIAAAAVVALLVAVYRHRDNAAVPMLAFEIEPARQPHRGAEPSVGDTLLVHAVIEGPGELRIYNDAGVEQARCVTPAPGCTVERSGRRTTLRLTMQLRAPGALRAVLFAGPVVGSPGGIDADLEAAVRAGIAVTPRDLVIVR